MRVAIVLNFPPDDHRMVYARGIAKELARRGHRVSLFVQRGAGFDKESVGRSYAVVGLEGESYSLGGQFRFMAGLVLSLLREDFDVIHGRNPFSSVLPPLLLRALGLLNAEIVYDVRGLWIDFAYQTGRFGRLTHQFLVKLESFSTREADGVLAISDRMRDALIERGVDPWKIEVIHGDGVDLEGFPPPPEHRDDKIVRIGYVGSISLVRGIGDILEAFEIVNRESKKETALELIGPSDKSINDIRRIINDLNLAGRVRIRGNLPHDQALKEIVKLDVALSYDSRLWQPLEVAVHTKVFEYLAAGLPIVATRHPSHEGILKHEFNAILTEPTPTDFASAILEVVSNRSLSEMISRNALETASLHHMGKKAEAVEKAYLNILRMDEDPR